MGTKVKFATVIGDGGREERNGEEKEGSERGGEVHISNRGQLGTKLNGFFSTRDHLYLALL